MGIHVIEPIELGISGLQISNLYISVRNTYSVMKTEKTWVEFCIYYYSQSGYANKSPFMTEYRRLEVPEQNLENVIGYIYSKLHEEYHGEAI